MFGISVMSWTLRNVNYLHLLDRLACALITFAELFNIYTIALAIKIYTLVSFLTFALTHEIDLLEELVFVLCHNFATFFVCNFVAAKILFFINQDKASFLDRYRPANY